jgi:hypothetical protein
MKQAFTCRSCGKHDEFETDTASRHLLESRATGPQEAEEFYVHCNHCGELNVVTVRLPRKP